tara:strand:- start:277 stop:486 length:210 start_codon:yes stop_codon:yes gene_type:complete
MSITTQLEKVRTDITFATSSNKAAYAVLKDLHDVLAEGHVKEKVGEALVDVHVVEKNLNRINANVGMVV